jgi:uncharacterized protein (UPF0548 family)
MDRRHGQRRPEEERVRRWRFGREWTDDELRAGLAALAARRVSFDLPAEAMTAENGWTVDSLDLEIGPEPPGPPLPDGLFERCRRLLAEYEFSNPDTVTAHFDPEVPLLGRDMLLEFRTLGFSFLNGVRVRKVRDEADDRQTLFGYRYDTLEGHMERGFEWFFVCKEHASGKVRFRVEERWQLGEFPTWWSRLGFRLSGWYFRARWLREGPERLRRLAEADPRPATQRERSRRLRQPSR